MFLIIIPDHRNLILRFIAVPTIQCDINDFYVVLKSKQHKKIIFNRNKVLCAKMLPGRHLTIVIYFYPSAFQVSNIITSSSLLEPIRLFLNGPLKGRNTRLDFTFNAATYFSFIQAQGDFFNEITICATPNSCADLSACRVCLLVTFRCLSTL